MKKDLDKLNRREKAQLYFRILSGAARAKLLESIVDFNLLRLIGFEGSLTAEEIIEKLELSPVRGKKWLYLLTMEKYLIEKKDEEKNTYSYSLGPLLKTLYITEDDWWFNEWFVYSWRTVCFEDMAYMLQGGEISDDISWPPKTAEDTASLEVWMTRTAGTVIDLLDSNIRFQNVKKMLDVGGGEGTIACALAQKHPSLHCTVYNLPEPVKLANNNIKALSLSRRVDTLEGNFLTDETFPKGYDLILFSRVLCDWPEEVCQKVIKMAYDALDEGGQIVICEPFKESNEDLIFIWEFRYMFWDDFGKGTFKPIELYENIFKELGFHHSELSAMDTEGVDRIFKAVK